MLIRPAVLNDAESLVEFQLAMARETEGRALDPLTVQAGVRQCLTDAQDFQPDAQRGCYYVAEIDHRIGGGLLVTAEWSDWRNGRFWWIQSVYVRPEYRGRGVYAALHRWVSGRARATPGVCGLRLYVDESNQAAQRVYERLGMTRTNYLLYETDWAGSP